MIFRVLILILGFNFSWALSHQCKSVFASVKARHFELVTDLFHGRVVEGAPFSANQNRQSVWKVKVYNPRSGRTQTAIFKPRPYGDAQGWNRTPMEYVTYELNLKLGMDLVPPVAYRYNLQVMGQHFSEGSLQMFIEGARRLAPIPRKNWGVDSDLFLSDARVLDVLMQNPDRHVDNFVMGRHWVDSLERPALIDHGANLRWGTFVTMTQPGAFDASPVRVFRPSILKALKELSFENLKFLKPFLTDDEIRALLSRRDGILKYAKSLGY